VSGLPDNWAYATLETLGQWGSGGTPPRTNPAYFEGGKIPWLIIGDLNDRVVTHAATHITEAGLANSSAKLLPPETLLVAMYGSIGKLGITGVECATNQAIAFCKPNNDVTSLRYLFYALMNAKDGLVALGQGGAQQNISQGILKAHEVPLAPLGEQTRIAEKLDTVLARVDACRDHLDRIPAILKRFRQSVLAAATSGTLTEEWRNQFPRSVDAQRLADQIHAVHQEAGGHKAGNAAAPTEEVHDLSAGMFPKGWRLITLRDVVLPDRPITYGILKPGPELEEGVPYVRVADFPGEKLNLTTIRKTSRQMDEDFKRSRLRPGDLLLSIRGTVGRLVVIPDELAGANITQDSARLSVQPILNRDYVLWYLRSSMAQDRMKGSTKGVAVRGINIGDVRALQLPLPSREEQDEIVRRVEALFASADRLEARYATGRAQVEKLTPATLAKAFRGELVPQDANDEPAASLLARIRTARAGQPTKIKERKTSGSPKMTIITVDVVRRVIERLPPGGFTFDDLRGQVSADYEMLKDIVFELLKDPTSGLKQVFDEESRQMRFLRAKP
jgi:type I restriction enzyme S subunit